MRESGHDTSYRLEGRCADLVTVDLNSLLYKIETDLAQTIEKEFNGEFAANGNIERTTDWTARANKRKELMNRYLFNPQRGMFFDYDFARNEQLNYVSATTLYPMWAGLATNDQAKSLVEKALPLLEMPGGIVASTEDSRGPITSDHPLRQWDYPYGWSPHQILTWIGLKRYGYDSDAQRLIYRWLYTITNNATQYNGTVPEKFDVVIRSHQVFAEYGNVGTKFAYITREGFGWTNASYQLGLASLSPELKQKLNSLTPPEWLFQ
jgi:alpha,alpha-trehalase